MTTTTDKPAILDAKRAAILQGERVTVTDAELDALDANLDGLRSVRDPGRVGVIPIFIAWIGPLDFGFDSDGGFIVTDRDRRRAAYAYPTSDRAERAKRSPEAVAREMADGMDGTCPDHIREPHFVHLTSALLATRLTF